jgi:hypothetical protein
MPTVTLLSAPSGNNEFLKNVIVHTIVAFCLEVKHRIQSDITNEHTLIAAGNVRENWLSRNKLRKCNPGATFESTN